MTTSSTATSASAVMSHWHTRRRRPSVTSGCCPSAIRQCVSVITTSCGAPRRTQSSPASFCCAPRCSKACAKPKRSPRRRIEGPMLRVLIASFVTMILAGGTAAQAQPAPAHWPERPIHFIVPFPAGSSSDIVARIVAQQLTVRLGQQLVVENRPGASGNLATEFVAHAQPDGYTLGLANTSTLALSPSLMAHPTYDPLKDFAPISMLGASPFVLAAYPGLPVHDVQGLIANLAGLLFNKLANVQLTPVSYRGSEQEVIDLIAGRVDTAYLTIPPTLQLIRNGKVRALAVTGP